jgi:hypothetical protein
VSESYASLDDYCLRVLERLKSYTDPARACELLAAVEATLTATDISDGAQKEFWLSLNHELNVFAHRLSRPSTRSVISARSVIAVAQAAIAQYQRRLKSEG